MPERIFNFSPGPSVFRFTQDVNPEMVIAFGLTAVGGLVWAVRTGQMSDFAAGARSIFDEDAPGCR